MIKTEIVEGRIEGTVEITGTRDRGAELVFRGRVRGMEDGQRISALYYEHYPGMTESELHAAAESTAKKFPIRDLVCMHRVGEIPVGEASMQVSIWSEHRREGLEAMAHFIQEVKRSVPIWKWAVLADGKRVPAGRHP